MPYSSADISGMIGGQMAMFSNQASYSQQLGGMVGTSPMLGGGGMANPFPQQTHMGSRIAGAATMGVGGAATGMSIAGGLMGGAAGWADPFTAGARGFMAGSGGFGAIGSAFAQGGLRAGIGSIGAGVGAAGVAALPATAGMMAASYAGQQMYQGVQNIGDVRAMSGHFGTQFGQPGAGMGGQMGHQTIKKITGALHELVGEDMRTTMEEIKTVMDQAGRMGMLTGITDAQTFKQKFGGIVKQVRQVADIMGTTLSEAAPMLGQLGQMGLWSGADIMGTAVSGRVAGQAAPQMMQSMQQGAMVSHAMGGTMRAGAMMGRESFMDIQAAQRAGVLSNRDIMEFTGGVGGAEGQRMMAGSMQGIMSRFGQTSAGRLMMAGLGARGETGEFTGGIDPERLQEFMSGGISVGGLQKLGRQGLTRGNQASFFDVQEELAQNLGAQGGIGAMGKITEQVLGKMGGEPKLRQQLMRQMLGVSNREAKALAKLMDEMPRIRDEQSRAAEGAINQAFEQLEQRQYRSWGALKEAVSGSFREGVSRPLQEAGERIASDFGEAWDRTMDSVTGRTRRIAMGTQERQRLIRGGALTQDLSQLGLEGVGQGFVTGGRMENLIRGIQQEGMGQIAGGAAIGGAIGTAVLPGLGTAAGTAMGGLFGAEATMGEGGMTQRAAALRRLGIGARGGEGTLEMGGGFTTTRAGISRGMQRAAMRAGGASRKAMGFAKDDAKIRDMKSAMNAAFGKSEKLRKLRKENPKGYAAALLGEMGYDVTVENLDMLSIAQREEEIVGDLAVDFAQDTADVVGFPTNFKELADAQTQAIDEMYQLAGGRNVAEGALGGAKIGAVAGGPLLAIPGAITGGIGGLIEAAVSDTGVRREDIERAMTGEGSDVMQRYLKGDITAEKAQSLLQRVKGTKDIGVLIDKIENKTIDKEAMRSVAERFTQFRGAQFQMEGLERVREMAARGPEGIELGRGAEGVEGAFKDLTRLYRGGANDTLEREELIEAQKEAQALAGRLTRDQAGEFAKAGAIGRQVAALFEVSEASKGKMAGAGQTRGMLQRLERMGFGLEQIEGEEGERLRELAKGGVKADEAEEFGKLASKAFKNMFSELTEARETHNEKMMKLLNVYAEANTKFVTAVGSVLGDDLKDEHAAQAAAETSKAVTQEAK
jgi:hypothetical protein